MADQSGKLPPSVSEARLLWERLRDGDRTASADLAATFFSPLIDWLTEHNRVIDPDLCETAAGDALVALFKDPASYQPERQTLEVYLRISAAGDLKNRLRSEHRHSAHRADWAAVELSPELGKYLQNDSDDPALIAERAEAQTEARAAARELIDRVRVGLSEEDSKVLGLILADARKTTAFALALGLTDRPVEEQERLVKRAKDRLKKRIKRAKESDE